MRILSTHAIPENSLRLWSSLQKQRHVIVVRVAYGFYIQLLADRVPEMLGRADTAVCCVQIVWQTG